MRRSMRVSTRIAARRASGTGRKPALARWRQAWTLLKDTPASEASGGMAASQPGAELPSTAASPAAGAADEGGGGARPALAMWRRALNSLKEGAGGEAGLDLRKSNRLSQRVSQRRPSGGGAARPARALWGRAWKLFTGRDARAPEAPEEEALGEGAAGGMRDSAAPRKSAVSTVRTSMGAMGALFLPQQFKQVRPPSPRLLSRERPRRALASRAHSACVRARACAVAPSVCARAAAAAQEAAPRASQVAQARGGGAPAVARRRRRRRALRGHVDARAVHGLPRDASPHRTEDRPAPEHAVQPPTKPEAVPRAPRPSMCRAAARPLAASPPASSSPPVRSAAGQLSLYCFLEAIDGDGDGEAHASMLDSAWESAIEDWEVPHPRRSISRFLPLPARPLVIPWRLRLCSLVVVVARGRATPRGGTGWTLTPSTPRSSS